MWRFVRQAEGVEQLILGIDGPLAAQVQGQGDARGDPHPESDSAAVGDAEPGRRLQRVARGMAVVENRARSAVALVLGHDQRLGGDAPEDHALEHGGVSLDQAGTISLQQVEESFVHGDGVLYNLGEGVPIARDRQRLDRGEVGDHGRGLPEGADRVFRAPAVDAGLAADARVHHGQQRGRHRDQPDAPLPDGGRQACKVADRAPAHGDHAAPAIDLLPLEKRQDVLQLGHGLGALARGDGVDGSLEADPFDRLRHLHRVRPDIAVSDDRRASRVEARDDVAQLALQVGSDQDRIAPSRRVEDQADQSANTSSATKPASRVPSTR